MSIPATSGKTAHLGSFISFVLLLALLALAGRATAQTTPAWQRVVVPTQSTASNSCVVRATAVDKTTGAVFVAGYFGGQVTFGNTVLTSMGGSDAFVARYDPGPGTWAWAKSGGGAATDVGYGIAVDGQGGVYITGYFTDSGTFAGQPTLSGTDYEVYVAAYEASDGTGRWAKSGGGAGIDQGFGIAADGQGGVYVTGTFKTSAIFAGQPALSGSSQEVFVAAYAASDGTGRWAKSGGGVSDDVGNGIAADGQGGVYVTGFFVDNGTFAGQPSLHGTGFEVFVAAYAASNGVGRWAKSGGGTGADMGSGIATDGQGGVYVTGGFGDVATFAGQSPMSSSGFEAFVAAYSASNGAGRWAKSNSGGGSGIVADGRGGVYITGTFQNSATFAGQPPLSGTDFELYVAAYAASNGVCRWAKSAGSAGLDFGYGVATDGTRLYVGGEVGLPARFDAITLTGPSSKIGMLAELAVPAVPYLTAISPGSGAVGSSVTLTGTNLTGATAVTFGGTANNTVTTGLTVSGSGSAQTITVAVPSGAATGLVTVTGPNGVSNGLTFTVTGAASPLTVSTGTLAAPVVVAAGTYSTLTVTSTGVAQLGGAVAATTAVVVSGTLLTNCQPLTGAATFTLNAGATLNICDVSGLSTTGSTGAVQVSGTRNFSTDASYVYSSPSASAQATGPGLPATVRNLTNATTGGLSLTQAVAVTQVVNLANATNLTLNGQALTLLSTAAGTALIANLGTGIVVGSTGTMQRYIGTNINSSGYRQYASPMAAVTGAEPLTTLATAGYTPDFSGAAAYNSSATPGLVTPFPTVFGYNQDRIATSPSNYSTFDKGWQAALGTDVPQAGRGYSVQAPGAALIDFTGTFTSGSVSRSNLQRASADANTGWHLLGNPYPSPLDWSTMTLGAGQSLDGVDGAVYVSQSSGPYVGSYRTYLAAAPGQGNPLIPAGSGFFVHTSSPATPGTVRFASANRVTTFAAQPAFGRTTADPRPLLTLAVQGNGVADAVSVYFDDAATAGIDPTHDAAKLPNGHGLNLATLAGATALAIDGRPAPTAAVVLPLSLGVPAAGVYTLSVPTLDNFGGLTLYLRDALLGTDQLLSANTAVPVSLPASATASLRFSLVLRPAGALATTGAVLAAQASLYPNPAHGAFTLRVPPVAGATQATATLLNALGQVVATRTLDLPASGTTAGFSTAGLAAGVYALRLAAGAEVATLRVVVE